MPFSVAMLNSNISGKLVFIIGIKNSTNWWNMKLCCACN